MVDISDIETITDNGIKRYILDSNPKIKRWIDFKFEEQESFGIDKYIDLSDCIIRNSRYSDYIKGEYRTDFRPILENVENGDAYYRNEIRLPVVCENSILYNLSLSFVVFRKNVSFNNTIIVGESIFLACIFSGNVSFYESCFCNHDPFNNNKIYKQISCLFKGSIFKGNVTFLNTEFSLPQISFEGATFEGYSNFQNVSFKCEEPSKCSFVLRNAIVCKRIDLQCCKIHRLDGSYMTIENGAVFRIYNSEIDSVDFTSLYNKGFLMLDENGSSIKMLTLKNSPNIGNIEIEDTQIKTIDNRKTARILKDSAYKSNNTIDALKFKRTEMHLYEKEVKNKIRKGYSIDKSKCVVTDFINYLMQKPIGECVLLKLNTWSNNNGLSWVRGALFTTGVALLFFTLINYFGLDGGEQIFVFDFRFRGFGDVWKGYLQILNVFNFRDVLPDFSLNAWGETLFLLSKIFISYGIYQTVSAFRKYGK